MCEIHGRAACNEQARAHAHPRDWRMSANRHRRGRVHSAEILSPILFLGGGYIPVPVNRRKGWRIGGRQGTTERDARCIAGFKLER